MIEHTFNVAKKSKYLDKIIVSTESHIIKKKIEKRIGKSNIIMRPKYLSKPNVGGTKVVTHLLNKRKNFDYIILLQPTSPLRETKDIDKSILKMQKNKFDSIVSIYRSKKLKKFPVKIINGFVQKIKKVKKSTKKNFYLNGAIYIAKVKKLLKNNTFFSSN